jgi:hypothetical protein
MHGEPLLAFQSLDFRRLLDLARQPKANCKSAALAYHPAIMHPGKTGRNARSWPIFGLSEMPSQRPCRRFALPMAELAA